MVDSEEEEQQEFRGVMAAFGDGNFDSVKLVPHEKEAGRFYFLVPPGIARRVVGTGGRHVRGMEKDFSCQIHDEKITRADGKTQFLIKGPSAEYGSRHQVFKNENARFGLKK